MTIATQSASTNSLTLPSAVSPEFRVIINPHVVGDDLPPQRFGLPDHRRRHGDRVRPALFGDRQSDRRNRCAGRRAIRSNPARIAQDLSGNRRRAANPAPGPQPCRSWFVGLARTIADVSDILEEHRPAFEHPQDDPAQPFRTIDRKPRLDRINRVAAVEFPRGKHHVGALDRARLISSGDKA